MKKKISFLILISTLIVGLTACGDASANVLTAVASEAEETAVTKETESTTQTETSSAGGHVVIGDMTNFFLIKVAEKKGFFEEEFGKLGYSWEVQSFQSGPALNESFAAKEVDVSILGAQPFIQSNANGVSLKALSVANYTEQGFAVIAGKDSGISDVADLKGKTISVTVGSNSHQALLDILAKADLGENDVEFVNLQSAEALAALDSANIDAALFGEPQITLAKEAGHTFVSDHTGLGYITCVFVGREDFLQEHPEVAIAFLKALDQAEKWTKANVGDAIALVAEYNDTDSESVEANYYSRERGLGVADEYLKKPLQATFDFLTSQELVDTSGLKVEELIDASYYEKAGIGE